MVYLADYWGGGGGGGGGCIPDTVLLVSVVVLCAQLRLMLWSYCGHTVMQCTYIFLIYYGDTELKTTTNMKQTGG